MKTAPLLATLCALVACSNVATAQEVKPPTQEELKAKFKETLTAATMTGRWFPLKDGVLGEAKEDKYSIVSVEKTAADAWTINARMKYGNREFVAPIPVQVKWAGDTAVIIVDKLTIPGPGGYGGTAYSARVLVHENTYAGHWSGGERAGLMNGTIAKDSSPAPAAK